MGAEWYFTQSEDQKFFFLRSQRPSGDDKPKMILKHEMMQNTSIRYEPDSHLLVKGCWIWNAFLVSNLTFLTSIENRNISRILNMKYLKWEVLNIMRGNKWIIVCVLAVCVRGVMSWLVTKKQWTWAIRRYSSLEQCWHVRTQVIWTHGHGHM